MPFKVLRLLLRAILFLLLTFIVVPLIIAWPQGKTHSAIIRSWHRGVCRLINLKVVKEGKAADMHGMLIVANHVSYLDIPVLGGFVDAHFVANSGLADWPFFGWLARIAECEFVIRNPVHAREQRHRLGKRLAAGGRLIMFPEATTTDGLVMLPFKSSLFQSLLDAAGSGNRHVQTISLAYLTDHRGRPLIDEERRSLAWYDDTPFMVHLLRTAMLDGATVTLRFNPAIDVDGSHCRKSIARLAEAQVREGLNAMGALTTTEKDAA